MQHLDPYRISNFVVEFMRRVRAQEEDLRSRILETLGTPDENLTNLISRANFLVLGNRGIVDCFHDHAR